MSGGSAGADDLEWGPAGLAAATRAGNLRLVFQPEFDLVADAIVAVEALSRWRHPTLGEVQPVDFIAAAEEHGVARRLGRWAVDAAVSARAAWAAAIPGLDVTVRINVAPAQVAQAQLANDVRAALERHAVPASAVCVEITERSPLGNLRRLAVGIDRLRELGVTCAIDDLASGHSTLGALRALPVDVVKIDRSLIAGIDDDARAHTIVAAVLRMAVDLGATVVAEGVENERELATLRDLGCTRVQGHFLARPSGGDDLVALLTARGRRTR